MRAKRRTAQARQGDRRTAAHGFVWPHGRLGDPMDPEKDDETTGTEQVRETPQEEPETLEDEPDYKALYEAEKKRADKLKETGRKWERQAKANKDAAEKLAQAEAEKAEEQAKEARAKAVSDLAALTGVPKEVLEACGAEGDALKAFAQAAAPHFKAETVPEVPGDGKSAGKVEPDEMKKFVHGLFNKD